MVDENRNANPIIIEPEASPNPHARPGLLAPSLHSSSSSSSFNSSSAQSRASSATSPSGSPSPTSRDVELRELTNIRQSTAADAEPPLPPSSPLLPNERFRNMTTSTTEPSERAEGSLYSNATIWLSSHCPRLSRRHWLEQSLGLFGLVASLVGLLFIGVRTYKLAVISTENSTLEGCTGLIQVSGVSACFRMLLTSSQAGFVTLENSTQLCKMVMMTGPRSSPYHLGKRTLHSSLALASQWMKGSPQQTCGFPYTGCQPQFSNITNRSISAPAIIISSTLALGGLIVLVARRNARSTEVFTSPALSDIHITRHKDTGPETTTGQGIIERHKSADHDLGEIHQRIRASQGQDTLMKDTAPLQSTDSSSSTLVDSCSEPRISLKDSSSGQKHDGLIELQINGHTKVFFKLQTGEFFHLKHWKDKCKDAMDSSHDKSNPLSVEGEDFARTRPNSSELAKKKTDRDEWIQRLWLNHKT